MRCLKTITWSCFALTLASCSSSDELFSDVENVIDDQTPLASVTIPELGSGELQSRSGKHFCEATGHNLDAAKQNYAHSCSQPRVDCDPDGHLWRCSSKQLGNAAPGRVEIQPNRPNKPDAHVKVCSAIGGNLDLAKHEYARHCSQVRKDCDPLSGGDWICSSAVLGDAAPITVAEVKPHPRPQPKPVKPRPKHPMCPCELLVDNADGTAWAGYPNYSGSNSQFTVTARGNFSAALGLDNHDPHAQANFKIGYSKHTGVLSCQSPNPIRDPHKRYYGNFDHESETYRHVDVSDARACLGEINYHY